MAIKLPKKIVRRILQFIMTLLNLVASILTFIGVLTTGPIIPILYGASACAFGLYMLSDIIQQKIQSKFDKISATLEKYKSDNGKISVKLDQITEFMTDLNSVHSELVSIKDLQTKNIPINNEPINEPVNFVKRTPRFVAIYNRVENTIEVSEEETPRN